MTSLHLGNAVFSSHLAFSYHLVELSQLPWVNIFSFGPFPSSEGFPSGFSCGSCLVCVRMLEHLQSLQERPSCHEQPL